MASARWLDGVRPYVEPAPLASLALGISSAFPLTMINATLASRLAEAGIEKKSVTAFALVILAYNLKWLWAWIVEGVKIPVLHRLGQRVSWLLVVAALVCAAAVGLGLADPQVSLAQTAMAAIALGIAGRPSISSSTPIASNCSSRVSSAWARAWANMAGASARRWSRPSHWSSRRGRGGASPIWSVAPSPYPPC